MSPYCGLEQIGIHVRASVLMETDIDGVPENITYRKISAGRTMTTSPDLTPNGG